jgi:hypothetical protein
MEEKAEGDNGMKWMKVKKNGEKGAALTWRRGWKGMMIEIKDRKEVSEKEEKEIKIWMGKGYRRQKKKWLPSIKFWQIM